MTETTNASEQGAAGRYETVFTGHDKEYERLAALCQELDEATIRRIEALQPAPDWRCLEIGAGTGTIARWMADRCARGNVVATEVDLRFLTTPSTPNLEVVEHDVTADDFPSGSFDLIHARWVFAHLRSRERDLARVASWLAPGGWLLLEEPAIFPVASSPDADYREVSLAADAEFARRMGTDANWPRSFPEPLTRLGLERTGLDGSMSVVGGGRPMGRFWAMSIERVAPHLVAAGTLSEAKVERVVGLLHHDDFCDFGIATIAARGAAARVLTPGGPRGQGSD